MTAADPGGGLRARVISCLVASVPGLGTAAAQRVLAAARADDGRALREVEVISRQIRKPAAGESGGAVPPPVRRSTIRRPDST